MSTSRRDFVKMVGSTTMLAPLAALYSRSASAAPSFGPGFGPLNPVLPTNTKDIILYNVDGSVAFDFSNKALISLPPGFSYSVVSWTGQTMSDGTRVPGDHDGMAAFRGKDGTTVLVRNHELSNRETKQGSNAGVVVADDLKYDTWCNGGTTTLIMDDEGRLVSDFASLGGTNNNCAGGLTPWGTWLTCEESTVVPIPQDPTDPSKPFNNYTKRHGYIFEVPADATGPVKAEPIIAMGRFNHEATATDPETGYVYQTEDRGDSCIYRYIPNVPGKLIEGGRLQALKLSGPGYVNVDPINGSVDTKSGFLDKLNVPLVCEWVDIDNVDLATDTVRFEAHAKGAAKFTRGEGMWYGDNNIYFVCSNGGDFGRGQVFAYNTVAETLTLIVESKDRSVIDGPDNITVGPDGRLYIYEDSSAGNNIVGVNSMGEIFRVAENKINGSEFAGGCFSHNGRFMFVNMQSPGLTLVIEGPWRKGQR